MFTATLGHQSSPNSFGAARTALCSLGEREQSSGAVPAPGRVWLHASLRSPRPADAAQMEGGHGVCWPKLGYLLKDLWNDIYSSRQRDFEVFLGALVCAALLCCSLAAKASVRHAGVYAARWGMCCRQELQLVHISLPEIHHNLPKAACSSQDWAESHKRKGI